MSTLLMKDLIERADGKSIIELDRKETVKFFDEREHWGKNVHVRQRLGSIMDLPWKPLPSRGYVKERYFINESEIKPAFDYWGLANSVRKRGSLQ